MKYIIYDSRYGVGWFKNHLRILRQTEFVFKNRALSTKSDTDWSIYKILYKNYKREVKFAKNRAYSDEVRIIKPKHAGAPVMR